ncbi:MAG: hypothetical protein HY814_07955, partial [Candidatus Riflebacteria bacterium]|nr:hypothetical protein [Candidatus Riflebacteria bacterium]
MASGSILVSLQHRFRPKRVAAPPPASMADGGEVWARRSTATAFDRARGATVLYGGQYDCCFPVHGLADTWTFDGVRWQQVAVPSPPGRLRHAMAYDFARRRVVLFGGMADTSSRYLDDTWEWDGTVWDQRAPATSPPTLFDAAMAYDAAQGRTLLFGGSSGTNLAETWSWDGTCWSRLWPSTSPAARTLHAMTYDLSRARIVLFGGSKSSGQFGDTWEWTGNDWRCVTPGASPPERYGHAMTYDTARQRVLLFGGQAVNTQYTVVGRYSDCWEWDGTNWTQLATASEPPSRMLHALAYDAAKNKAVVFGGSSYSSDCDDTWLLTFGAGQPNTAPTPSAGSDVTVQLDALVQLEGYGTDPDGDGVTYTWVRAGGTGTAALLDNPAAARPVFRAAQAGTYEWTLIVSDGKLTATDSVTVTVEASASNNLPRISLGKSLAATVGQSVVVAAGVYDPDGDALACRWERTGGSGPPVDFDGSGTSSLTLTPPREGTYEFRLTVTDARGETASSSIGIFATGAPPSEGYWVQRRPSRSPSARTGHCMAYDPSRRRILLFGGRDVRGALLGDTWEWDGTAWRRFESDPAPCARERAATAFDETRQRVILVGGRGADFVAYSDVWEWTGAAWSQLSASASFPARSGHALASDPDHRTMVMFGGSGVASSGVAWQTLADTWEFDGTSWHDRTPPLSPTSGSTPTLAFDRARGQVLLFWSMLFADPHAETWEWTGSLWQPLSPPGSPTLREYHTLVDAGTAGGVRLIGGAGTWQQPLSDCWRWDGQTWAASQVPAGFPALQQHAAAFDSSRSRVVVFGGWGQYLSDATWELTVASGSGADRQPRVEAGGNQTATVGVPIALRGTAQAAGGIAVTASWSVQSGPDAGRLLDAQTLEPRFVATSGGTYVLRLDVADSSGNHGFDTVQVLATNPIGTTRLALEGKLDLISLPARPVDTLSRGT